MKPHVIPRHVRGIEFTKSQNSLKFVLKSKRGGLFTFMLIFSAFWNLITWFVLFGVGKSGISIGPEMILFITHPTIGIITAYFALVLGMNKTHISVSTTKVRCSVQPLPWFGNFTTDRRKIGQIYVEQYVAFHKNDEPIYRFSVKGISPDGKFHTALAKGIYYYEEALFIEQEIEKLWSIKDQSVPEEFKNFG